MKKLSMIVALMLLAVSLFGCAAEPAEPASLEDWAYIEDKGTMVIGITYYEPMNYLDDSGKLVGFDTEFAEALCAELGVTPEFIEINWDTKEVELAAKSIDAIWNGLTVTEERKENMDFSQSYIKNMQVCVIKADNADTYKDVAAIAAAGANLTAEAGSAGEGAIQADEQLKTLNYTPVSYQSNALMEVKAGTSDVAVLDYVMAKAMVGEGTDYTDLQMIEGLELNAEEYAIGFRKNSPETLKKVDEAINTLIENGTLDEIAEKNGLFDSLLSNQ